MATRKRKPKMPRIGKGRRSKASLAMAPTRGIDPSMPTAPKAAAPMSKPRRGRGKGYRDRMDAMEL